VTSNPTIFEKAISGSTNYDVVMQALLAQVARSAGFSCPALIAYPYSRPFWMPRKGGGFVSNRSIPIGSSNAIWTARMCLKPPSKLLMAR
jgi:hypothetical protein